MKCKDGSTLYIRQSSELNEKQKRFMMHLRLNTEQEMLLKLL
ncbi:MAG: hypothetical protein Q9M43_14785 [Sulfurimonas sp.]|nr:hypothetical protein [Sulfurimonas sp.]